MRVLIVEDEPQAAKRLETLVSTLLPSAQIVDKLDTVKGSVAWLKQHAPPDLLLLDVQLADGLSFQIFDAVEIISPVIFTTAYDAYALKAFKVNSIDYILKPVDQEELGNALAKVRRVTEGYDTRLVLENIHLAMNMLTRKYKTRFVLKVGEHLRTVEVDDIVCFFSQDKATFCTTRENRNLILDYTLDQLQDMVDPERFFRINRKYIISAQAIQDIISYSNSRLRLVLNGSVDHDIIVARERVQEFKSWLDR